MMMYSLEGVSVMPPCWVGWMKRRSGHAITLCNAGLEMASRCCQAPETRSGAVISAASHLDDSPGCKVMSPKWCHDLSIRASLENPVPASWV